MTTVDRPENKGTQLQLISVIYLIVELKKRDSTTAHISDKPNSFELYSFSGLEHG